MDDLTLIGGILTHALPDVNLQALYKVEQDTHTSLIHLDYSGIDWIASISDLHYGIAWRRQDWRYQHYRTFTVRHHRQRRRPSEYERLDRLNNTTLVPALGPQLMIHAYTSDAHTVAAVATVKELAAAFSHPDCYYVPYPDGMWCIPFHAVPQARLVTRGIDL